MVPNKSLGEFDSFDNSNWKVGGSSAVSNVTYAYGPWSSGSFNSSNFTMSHTRSCLRNDNVAVDCSYCGGICSYTSAATYIDTHASYTGWRCGGHGGDIYVYWNHYYIDGQPFSHSWINCGIPWGYQVTFSGTYQTWDSYFSVYIPPSD